MGIGLSDSVEPLGTFAIAKDIHLQGGFRVVADLTERDAISTSRRSVGMLVRVLSPSGYFTLEGGTSNGNWTAANFGGGASSGGNMLLARHEGMFARVGQTGGSFGGLTHPYGFRDMVIIDNVIFSTAHNATSGFTEVVWLDIISGTSGAAINLPAVSDVYELFGFRVGASYRLGVFLGSFGLRYYNISIGYDNTLGIPTVSASLVGSNPLAVQSNFGYRCAVFGKYAYITTSGSATIQLLNLDTNSTPTIVYTHTSNLFGIAYGNGKLFTSNVFNELMVFDVDPSTGSLSNLKSVFSGTFYDLVFDGEFVWGHDQGTLRLFDTEGTVLQLWNLSIVANPVSIDARIAPDGIGGVYLAGGRADIPGSGALYRFVPKHAGPVLNLPYPSDTNSEGMGVSVTDNGDVAVACKTTGYQLTFGGGLYDITLAAQDQSYSEVHQSFNDLGNITGFPGTTGTYPATMPSSFTGALVSGGTNLTRFWVEITVNTPTTGNTQFMLEAIVNGGSVVAASFNETGTGTFYVEVIPQNTFVPVLTSDTIALRIGEDPPALGTSIDWNVRFGVAFDFATNALVNVPFTSSPAGPSSLPVPSVSNRAGYTITRAHFTITVNSIAEGGPSNPFEIGILINGNLINPLSFLQTSTGTFDQEVSLMVRVPTPLQSNTFEIQVTNPIDDPVSIDWDLSVKIMYRTAYVPIGGGFPPGGTLVDHTYNYEVRQNNPYGTALAVSMFVNGGFVTSTGTSEPVAPSFDSFYLSPSYGFTSGQEYAIVVFPQVGGEHFLTWHQVDGLSNFDAPAVTVQSYRSMARDDKAVGDFKRLLLSLPDGKLQISNGRVTSTLSGGLSFTGETRGDLTFRGASVWERLPAGTDGQVLRTQGSGADPIWASQLQFSGEAQGDTVYHNGTTWQRLPAGTNGQVLRTQGSGADPQWTAQIVVPSETQGDILYYNGSGWTRLPAGTSGQFLKTNGTGVDPSWAAASGGTSGENGGEARSLRSDMFGTPIITSESTVTNYTIQDAQWFRGTQSGNPVEGVLFLATHQSIAGQTVQFLRNGTVTTIATLANAPLSLLVYGNQWYAFAAFQAWRGDMAGSTTQLSVANGFSGFGAVVNTFASSIPKTMILATNPGQNTVLSIDPATGTIATVLTGISGARAICRGEDFSFWVALNNSTIQKYTYGSLASPSNTPTLAMTVSLSLSILTNLVFDGKYVWGCSQNTLYRISSDGTVRTRSLSSTISGSAASYAVDRVSKLAFDGYTIWATGSNGRFTRIEPETMAFLLDDTSTFSGIAMGAVACAFDGNISRTFIATTAVSGGDTWRQFRTITNDINIPSEAQGDILYRSATGWTRLPAGTSGQTLRTQGTGADPQWANQIVIASEAQGDIIYRNATTWTRLPAGTSGQVLTTGGTGANPSWTTPSGGASTPNITTVTTSYTVLSTDTYVRCNHTSSITITLPSSPATAQFVNIKDVSSAGAGTNNIVVVPSTGTIDGQGSIVIATNRGSLGLVYVGSNAWDLI